MKFHRFLAALGAMAVAAILSAEDPNQLTENDSRMEIAPPGGEFVWVDLDRDGLRDALSLPHSGPLQAFRNLGDGELEDVTRTSGLGAQLGVRVAAACDFDRDQMTDLLLVGPSRSLKLYRQTGALTFEDVTVEFGLPLELPAWHAKWLDYDQDGWLDLQVSAAVNEKLFRNVLGEGFVAVEFGLNEHVARVTSSDQSPTASTDTSHSTVTGYIPIPGAAGGVVGTPGGSTLATGPPSISVPCAGAVEDSANPGICIDASTTPQLGSLYPISQELFVDDATGNVGIGTTSPSEVLEVAGTIRGVANDPQALYVENSTPAISGGGTAIYGTSRGAAPTAQFKKTIGPGLVLEALGTLDNGLSVDYAGATTVTSGLDTTLSLVQLGNSAIFRADNGSGEVFKIRNAGGIVSTADQTGLSSAAVVGVNTNTGSANAIFGESSGTGTTAYFRQNGTGSIIKGENPSGNAVFRVTNTGRVVTSALEITGGGDLVEGFGSSEGILVPGTVVVIDPENEGQLLSSSVTYDRRVAGVVSGAGGVNHGIRMGQEDVLDGENLIAMTGRVYARCSAENGSIEAGDLLTTSSLAGHAMKATDAGQSFGAVIGKAMGSLDEGTGLVLVLVNLQ